MASPFSSQLGLTDPAADDGVTDAMKKKQKECDSNCEPQHQQFPPPYCTEGGDSKMEMENYWMGGGANNVDLGTPHEQCECKFKKKKKCMGKVVCTLMACLVVAYVAYHAGKRCGFWKGLRIGKHLGRHGCRDSDGEWRHQEGGHHDGGHRGGHSCSYKRRGEGEHEKRKGDMCVRDDSSVEWDSGAIDDKGGYRWTQMFKQRAVQILDYINEDTARQQCNLIEEKLSEEGTSPDSTAQSMPEMGSWAEQFSAFLEKAAEMGDQISEHVFDQTNTVNVTFIREKIEDSAELQKAKELAKGVCAEDAQFFKLIRRVEEKVGHCNKELEMVMNKDSSYEVEEGTATGGKIDLGLYKVCIQ